MLPFQQLWPNLPQSTEIYSSKNNLPILASLPNNLKDHFLPDNFEKRFSSWDKYVRLYGYVLRFTANAINIPDKDSETDIYQRGERALIRSLQIKYFHAERKMLEKGLQPAY